MIIQLLRNILDQVAPFVLLITKTNVPHQENLSYFGLGTNEAQLVYNFALPPLILHTFHTGDSAAIRGWAAGLKLSSKRNRFVGAHAILLSLVGVPGIYFHSLFGSRNWPEGVAETGRNRTINRQKFLREDLERELTDPKGLRGQVFEALKHLLRIRAAHPAFHPNGDQRILLDTAPAVFALWREAPDGSEQVLCLQNVSQNEQPFHLEGDSGVGWDLISAREVTFRDGRMIELVPYQTMWLTVK